MHEERYELVRELQSRFEGVEVIEGNVDVCAGNVCDEFGGCANCRRMHVAREIDEHGKPAGPTRLFLCTHWCHEGTRA